MPPLQRAAAIVLRLGGVARELLRSITPEELVSGGVVNCVLLDPITYIVSGL